MNSKLEAIELKKEAILMLRKFSETNEHNYLIISIEKLMDSIELNISDIDSYLYLTEIFNQYGLFEYSINILNKALKFKPKNNKLLSLLENTIIIKESEHKIEPNMFNFEII